MQIDNATVAQANTDIDNILNRYNNNTSSIQSNGVMYNNLNITDVINILKQIKKSYTYSEKEGNLGLEDEMDNIIKILSDVCNNGLNGNAPVSSLPVVKWDNRDLSRKTRDEAWSTGVLTGKKGNNAKSDSEYAKDLADSLQKPVLVLTKQNGDIKKGWTGHEFYWPVIVFPQTKLACNTLIVKN